MAVTEKKEKKDYSIVEKKQEDSNIFTEGIVTGKQIGRAHV